MFFVVSPIAQAKSNYAYVANNSDNTVSVINTSNNTVMKTISVGIAPNDVAVDQAGKSVYVTNSSSNTVSIISTSTNAVVATLSVQADPVGVALSPNGKTAYVANYNSNSVSVINTGTKKVTATVTVQTNPFDLAVTPNGAFVYVANLGSNTVSVISTLTNTVVASVGTGAGPGTVAISPDGSTAYVGNHNTTTVSVIRTADNSLVNTISLSTSPFSLAVSPDGHYLYVTEGPVNTVAVIDTSTQTVAATIVAGSRPEGVSFTQDGAFAYVTNKDSNDVSVINTASQTVINTIAVGAAPLGAGVMGPIHVSTIIGGYLGDKGPAASSVLAGPFNTVQDKAGNYYVSDRYHNRIRKITPSGTITTFAGTGICGYNGENVSAKKAMLCLPIGLALDSAGNLYVTEDGNARVRKISASGKITTVAGTGIFGYSGDGGPATSAEVNHPWGITFDSAGNLYFSDSSNYIVRKVDSSGTISTYAGTPGVSGFSGDGGPATSAKMIFPVGIGFDGSANLYIADGGRVRIVAANGTINTFAGNGHQGCFGDGGPALSASIGHPLGIAINNGALYIGTSDYTYSCARVRAVDLTSKNISTFAGSSLGYDGDNNPALSSRFTTPVHTLFDAMGNVLISDNNNGRVRKLSGALVTTCAGGYLGDGNPASSAALVSPAALAIDKSNNLYIADYEGHRIRKVSGGKVTTVAGTGVNGYSGDGGPATSATLNFPVGVAVDLNGNVFIADEFNNVVRKVDASGNISTFASDPNFCDLERMATDSSNNLYVADDCTSVIFKITPTGTVSIVAGVPFNYGYNGDGIPANTALLSGPYGVAVDNGGNILIADTDGSRVRLVDTSGIIHTIAGDGNCNDTGDGGSATAAEVCNPFSLTATKSGTIYFADVNYERIRAISGGIITAFAGNESTFNGDGLWPLLTAFDGPSAVAVDSKGALYALEAHNARVRKIQ